MNQQNITIDCTATAPMRSDKLLATEINGMSRQNVARGLQELKINGIPAKPTRKLHVGDHVFARVIVPPSPPIAEDMDIDILYEDTCSLILNKPIGIAVHPGIGIHHGTISQALVARYPLLHTSSETPTNTNAQHRGKQATLFSSAHPGIVHRLDKDTSGALLAAKDPAVIVPLQTLFQERKIEKCYIAVVYGTPPQRKGTLVNTLVRHQRNRRLFCVAPHEEEGRIAITDYMVLRSFASYSILVLRPLTGRTHQIRVQLAAAGYPIIGDILYASRRQRMMGASRLYLHAARLRFTHPISGAPLRIAAPLPLEFHLALDGNLTACID